MSTIVIAKSKWPLGRLPRCGSQECCAPRRAITPTELLDAGERLPERFREVGFIEQDQAIRAEEAGVDGLHPIAYAEAPE
jgi:hypothetical protein